MIKDFPQLPYSLRTKFIQPYKQYTIFFINQILVKKHSTPTLLTLLGTLYTYPYEHAP